MDPVARVGDVLDVGVREQPLDLRVIVRAEEWRQRGGGIRTSGKTGWGEKRVNGRLHLKHSCHVHTVKSRLMMLSSVEMLFSDFI